MSKKLLIPYPFLYFVCAVLLFWFSDAVNSSISLSLVRCAQSIIPSFFPLMVLSRQIYAGLCFKKCRLNDTVSYFTGFSFRLLPIFFTGLVCGYPLPAVLCKKALDDKNLSEKEAELAAIICNNASPAFVILLVGKGVFGDITAGVILYILQIFSVICTAHIFCRTENTFDSYGQIKKESFAESVSEAVKNILRVCGFVVFFSVVSDAVKKLAVYMGAPSVLGIFLAGTIEVTGALPHLYLLPYIVKVIFSCAFCAFGGLSVYFQIAAIIKTDLFLYIKIRGTVFLFMTATFFAVLKIFELMSLL